MGGADSCGVSRNAFGRIIWPVPHELREPIRRHHRIAEAEKIQVTPEEVDERIRKQAAHYNVSVEKMRKEIDEREGMNGLVEEILLGKTIDFLKANVSVKIAAAEDKKSGPPEENS